MRWTPVLQKAKTSNTEAPSPSRLVRWAKKDPDGGNFDAMLNPLNPEGLGKIEESDEVADGVDVSERGQ
jgi:hypothetical protein